MSKKNARGLGTVFKRGNVWWIKYYQHGKPIRESSKSTKQSDATKLLKQRLGEIGQGRLVGPSVERVTLEDMLRMLNDDYEANARRSKNRVQGSLNHLRDFFGGARAIEITTDRISAYIRYRLQEDPKPAPATVKLELSALKRAFNLAVRAQKLAMRPYIPNIDVRNTRTGFFEASELREVLKHLTETVRPVVRFGYLTGWRINEILTLTWRQVDLKAGVVRLEPGMTKNKEGRTFPISALPALNELLKDQRSRTDQAEESRGKTVPWVFHRNGKRITSIRHQWKKACAAAGVPGRYFHDLRRTAVRNLERAGVPRSVAMKLTGHLTESVYRRYAIVNESDLADGVRKLRDLPDTDIGEAKVVEYRADRRTA